MKVIILLYVMFHIYIFVDMQKTFNIWKQRLSALYYGIEVSSKFTSNTTNCVLSQKFKEKEV